MRACGRVLVAVLGVMAMLVSPAVGQEGGGAESTTDEAWSVPTGAVGSPVASRESAETAARYWTAERMANAQPRDIAVIEEDGRLEYLDATTTEAARGQAAPVPRPYTDRPDRMIGRIFGTDIRGDFSCSGSVVAAGNRSVVATAGHCIYNIETSWAQNVVFVPAFGSRRANRRPLGTWSAYQLWADAEWLFRNNLEVDVGAVVIRPKNGRRIQQRVGGHRLGFNKPVRGAVVPWGYPARFPFSGQDQWRCLGPIVARGRFPGTGPRTMGVRCNLKPGSSGGPWLRGFDAAGTGMVVSVNSYRYRGSPILFGPYFGDQAREVFRTAGQSDPGT